MAGSSSMIRTSSPAIGDYLCCCVTGHRKAHGKAAALARMAGDAHCAAVRFGDELHDAKPQTTAAYLARQCLVHLVKTVKNVPHGPSREADSVVADGDVEMLIRGRHPDMYPFV